MTRLIENESTIGVLEKDFKKKNPEKYKVLRSWMRENARKLRIIKDKGGVCECCKLDGMKYPWLIDIHHTDPSKKEMKPSEMYDYPYRRVQKELESCILLCANCHRNYHNTLYFDRYTDYAEIMKEKIELAHLDYKDMQKDYKKQMYVKCKELIDQGLTFRQMKKILGISISAIHKFLKGANLKPNYEPHWQGKISKEVFLKIKELKAQGLPSRKIAKLVNVSKTSVLNHWDADTY